MKKTIPGFFVHICTLCTLKSFARKKINVTFRKFILFEIFSNSNSTMSLETRPKPTEQRRLIKNSYTIE